MIKQRLQRVHQAIKEWVTSVLLKKVITPFALVVIYFLILGPTSLVAKMFFRSALAKTSDASTSA